MSSESEDPHSVDQPADTRQELQKNVKFSYTRDFLMSLSTLDVCKKLPSGFDKSILSEFEEAFHSQQDRPRNIGGFSAQGYRRTDYSSSPPIRGDSSSYSHGAHGKWDSRSRDSDSQSDRDSDSGRRYGNHSRQSWQNHEHDGLLGSGSFPKAAGYVTAGSASKFQANDRYQLNRSNAPYQPPRPYKAGPHSRRDGKDSFNAETFDSAECITEDQAEEERKRRASFEMMRKEQQKTLHEKQTLDSDKHKDLNLTALLEDSENEKKHSGGNLKSDDSLVIPASESDSGKYLLPSQTPAPRPLVPPGFKSTVLEKGTGTKPLIHPRLAEVGSSELDSKLMHIKGNTLLDRTSDNQKVKLFGDQKGLNELQHDVTNTQVLFGKKSEAMVDLTSTSEDHTRTGIINDDQQYKASNLSEAGDNLLDDEIIELVSEKGSKQSIMALPTSILQKLLGSSLTVNNSKPSISEHPDGKLDDTWSLGTVQSSKFAHWFHEDEKKLVDDHSSTRSNDLLSLIGGGEKGGILASDTNAPNSVSQGFPFQSSEFANQPKASLLTAIPIGEQLSSANKPEPLPVLTCEDLEQSLLSEVSGHKSVLEVPLQGWNALEAKTKPKEGIDNQASQHLLSLLQKGPEPEDLAPPSSTDIASHDKQYIPGLTSMVTAVNNPREGKSEEAPGMSKALTLEALFGPAFMKELQSADAPVFVQRSSAGSSRYDVPESYPPLYSLTDNGTPSSTINESSISLLNPLQQNEMDKRFHLGYDGLWQQGGSSKVRTELGSKLDGRVGYQLPEEGIPTNHLNTLFALAGNASQPEVSSSKRPVGGPETLGALSAIFKEERSMLGRQDDQPSVHDFYDMFDPKVPYQNARAQPPQLHPPHMNHGRPMFNPSDMHSAHINPQMEFPDRMIHRDPPPGHQFSPKMFPPSFHHADMGSTTFDHPAHHPMQQQMHMPGNFPLPHLIPEFPMGAPQPSHPNSQVFGFRHEPSRLPISHQQPGIGDLGISPPVRSIGNVGNNHPEALQRLLEMELRSNQKPVHPFPGPLGSLNL